MFLEHYGDSLSCAPIDKKKIVTNCRNRRTELRSGGTEKLHAKFLCSGGTSATMIQGIPLKKYNFDTPRILESPYIMQNILEMCCWWSQSITKIFIHLSQTAKPLSHFPISMTHAICRIDNAYHWKKNMRTHVLKRKRGDFQWDWE